MRVNRWPWIAIAALALAAGAGLGWQRRTAAELRGEIVWQRAQDRERARLRAEHQRLIAAQPTAEQLESALAERAAVSQLQAELDSLRHRAQESAAARRAERPEQAPPTPP